MRHNKSAIIDLAANSEPQPSLRLRQLRKFSGSGVIVDELHKDAWALAAFRVRVKHLRKFPRVEWHKKQFRSLGDGLFEIKWVGRKTEWRALGYDAEGYFVVVKICTHKDNVYDPSACIAKARELKDDAKRGLSGVISYEL